MHVNTLYFVRCLLQMSLLVTLVINTRAQTEDVLEIICQPDVDGDEFSTTTAAPPTATDEYCTCDIKVIGLSRMLQVKCDLRNEKKVLLTKNIYSIGKVGFSSAYVRISNALQVVVTETFMKEWQQALSSALDIWHSGLVSLASSPPIYKRPGYKTFVGIGIINCKILNVPPKLLRDHHRGALRIKQSQIEVVHPGFIQNIDELRYLVFEDCTITRIGGAASLSGALTLSHKELHTWNGLLITNVSVESVGASAFNLTHLSDVETVVISNSRFGFVDSGSFIVSGDISVNVSETTFDKLATGAFQFHDITAVEFSNNRIESWSPGALLSIKCPPNSSSIADNVIVTSSEVNNPTLLFDSSCGTPECGFNVCFGTKGYMANVKIEYTGLGEAVRKESGSMKNLNIVVKKGGAPEKVTKAKKAPSGTLSVVAILLILLSVGGVVGGVYFWRNRIAWSRNTRDLPLFEDQDQPDTVPTCTMNNKAEPVVILTR